jgi:hypothetical protein
MMFLDSFSTNKDIQERLFCPWAAGEATRMNPLRDYHHFKAELIEPSDKVAQCERYVVDILLASTLPDSARESSIAFELKHHAAVTQFARLLARKRGLPIDSCTIGALLHDIYVIVHGKYSNHANLGAPIAEEILDRVGGFTVEEKSEVARIVFHHSDKHVWTRDAFQEFGKDVDILDCFLYPGAFGYYLRHFQTSQANWHTYLDQLRNIRSGLTKYFAGKYDLPGEPLAALGSPIAEYVDIVSYPDLLLLHPINNIPNTFTAQAEWMLSSIQEPGSLLVVWPAIDAYEILEADDAQARANELGLAR